MRKCYHCKGFIFKEDLVKVMDYLFHRDCLEGLTIKIPAPKYWILPDGSRVAV